MPPAEAIDPRLLDILACPRDRTPLHVEAGALCCGEGHRYPVVDGVPVFLLGEQEQTIGIASASLRAAESGSGGPLYLDTLGLDEAERRGVERDWQAGGAIDPAIAHLIGATSGWGYVHLIGRLGCYPIPRIPVGPGRGELLLDVGANWGRWSVAAARMGWRVIALEPSLGAIMASRRAFAAADPGIAWVCGDARFLPFKADTFGAVFSYSVLQHFAEADAERAIAEMGRVLRRGGFAKVQMANRRGLRSTYSCTRADYQAGGVFRVRYWPLAALRAVFARHIGPAAVQAEAFGGLGLLAEDRALVSAPARALIALSAVLKKLCVIVPALRNFADSVYVTATKQP